MAGLRRALLPFTIQNAARLRYYAEAWAGADLDAITSVEELVRLPTLSKADYRRCLMFDDTALGDAYFITHTTGTTGELTWRHRSVAEAAVVADLFRRGAATPQEPLVLAIRNNSHGMAMPVPGRGRTIPASLNSEGELRQCLQMLTAEYHFGDQRVRPSIVAGDGRDVALLAQAFLESGACSDTLAVETLLLAGFVDAGLHRFLHGAFNGPAVLEKYSLSEIFGGASRAAPATSFVLDPYVVGEVVDEQGAPVAPGRAGELVLTELFPFVQLQPLIRYRTGDVVVRLEAEGDDVCFDWWGRRADCALSPESGTWVLGYRPLADWLADHPLVARRAHSSHIATITSTSFGPPCFSLRQEPDAGHITLSVGLVGNPWWSRTVLETFVDELWAATRSMVHVPAATVRVSLAFAHVTRPTRSFAGMTGVPFLRLPPAPLSGAPPPLP